MEILKCDPLNVTPTNLLVVLVEALQFIFIEK